MENQCLQLKEPILKTIVFYDIFDCPLTPFEIWSYCGIECSLADIVEALDDIRHLGQKSGFYFLQGREETVAVRLQNYNHANRKFKRALRVARLFKLIPWIRMIAVGNQMGANNLRDESDIDFFIITEPKRIWITRWFCAGIAKVLKLRPQPGKKRDTICLSFYITSENLDTRRLMLENKVCHDIYYVNWLANLVPIYDREGTYNAFMEANAWLAEYLPNWQRYHSGHMRDVGPGFSNFYRDVVDMLIGGADSIVKRIQLHIMPEALHRAMNIDTRTIVNDKILKLYINDRREEYRGRYLERLRML
ncbi:MAG: hypothetical protein US83_C0006G0064 [Candidatus Falkowbacteria bacterium GW2011_GWC2_38_22]|uniref:Polymerase nucleotidyl transferase domain-containing protein n=1 Tax=Candidatus Falkowbacteria bacterium GW2011_GWE1_38_31 TaxID=1618638 RepID=A0A0G0N1V8_9BACT|nr:MAG: hypothetical protein US73_C0001G0023 [Candidatus Falkowbacteria bacterium GW2011_GWF2_38_1205]KKQ61424.1 MAG: hypothetical protein US83_C0006G0064 [Candidatus Falkowbacteria bacterium GW2011_GWC2_38_22]KKQ63991.1 MAG: hypothetical protein US84_C0002G0023 [Candidatus Falkowbacteria bacterium GW2011_GWF1_38_22]KKQ66661.1 MAG: hypothetical protein US87_C0001G0182 [Candidatus Falkowbacteria bacterium GW2011_GWE2_38_254]KKQ71096.1 MAG: hypothetical protein US91_C0001G0023 [Candidatus Falkowb